MENPLQHLKAANRLPTPPGVAIRILQLVASETATIDEITLLISGDPALTAKIMKFISSPLMGLGFRGTTLGEAVARIGMRGTQMMALSFSLVSQKHRESCPSFHFDAFWSESLARAVAARCLAKQLVSWDPEEAFVTGLLARIGQLVLATGLPKEYEPVLRKNPKMPLSLEERERAVFGQDHLETGKQLLREWNLPEVVWKTAGLLAPGQERENRSARVIEVADVIARFLIDDTRHTPVAVRSLAALARDRLEIDPDAFRPLLGAIGQDWIHYGGLLSVPTAILPELDVIESQAEDQRTALRVASEVEVQNLRAENQQLGRLARRDRLTGLLNRAAFHEELPAVVARTAEAHQPLALLLIDVDRFKAIRDAQGSRTGDAVLERITFILEGSVRKRDQVFRFGGAEFAVLAADCHEDDATALAERIRAAVERAPFAGTDAAIALTVSIGIGWLPGTGARLSPEELIDCADDRLRDAHHAGRNAWRIHAAKPGRWWWSRLGRALSGAKR